MIMAALSSRFSGIGENLFGDQEKDSNALLLELDKGCDYFDLIFLLCVNYDISTVTFCIINCNSTCSKVSV